MNTFKSAVARAAVVLAFVVSGCASVDALDHNDILASMHDSSQLGGE